MKTMIPSHAKKVRRFRHKDQSIFEFNKVGEEIATIYKPNVELKSGGYIVINQTEALVAIDVNSGRSIKERDIEETALKTNLEAAEEAANQIKIERFMKDQLKNDRARNQIGQISSFGLLEMSRQRIGTSISEMQDSEVSALEVLRKIENQCTRNRGDKLFVYTCPSMLPYLINEKRRSIVDLESKYDTKIYLYEDNNLPSPNFRISTDTLQNWKVDGEIVYDSTRERGAYQRKSYPKRRRPVPNNRGGEDIANTSPEKLGESKDISKKNKESSRRAKYPSRGGRRKYPFRRPNLISDKKAETKSKKSEDAVKTKSPSAESENSKDTVGKKVTNLLLRKLKKVSDKKDSPADEKKTQEPKKKRAGWWQKK